jgi:hypothetical protein
MDMILSFAHGFSRSTSMRHLVDLMGGEPM